MTIPAVRTSYLHQAMCTRTLPLTVRKVKHMIRASGVEFNAIAFRGMSGALVSPTVAMAMKKGIIVCRKPEEKSHSYMSFEGYDEGGNYIIVDDFIGGGNTIRSILTAIYEYHKEHHRKRAEWQRMNKNIINPYKDLPPFNPVGIFLYDQAFGIRSHFDWGSEDGAKLIQVPIFR